MAEVESNKQYSKAPCRKCGAYKVTVDAVDVPSGIDYVLDCEACGDHYGARGFYRVDGRWFGRVRRERKG